MDLERRYLGAALAPVVVRSAQGVQTIEGYAARFYDGSAETEFQLGEGMIERIRPTAFARALREQHDCRGLYNHDPDVLLGRTTSGTLTLKTDSKGLRYVITVNVNDPDHQRVVEKINRGDLSGSSFAFKPIKTTWEKLDGVDVRWIDDVTLYDVGPVVFPAYAGASTSVRADDVAAIELERRAWHAKQLAGELNAGDELRQRRAALLKSEATLQMLKPWSHLYQREPNDDNETLRRKLQLASL